MEGWLQDLRSALRSLRHSPGFAATGIAILALAIGANTAIFSVVNSVLLQPLAYPDPDRIVQLGLTGPGGSGFTMSTSEFMACRARTEAFQNIAAYDFGGPGVNLTNGDRPEHLKAIHVSADYFQLFGASMEAGRSFSADEDRPGGNSVVVIADRLWRSRFGADPGLIGKPVSLGNEPHLLVGVVGPNFQPAPRQTYGSRFRPTRIAFRKPTTCAWRAACNRA